MKSLLFISVTVAVCCLVGAFPAEQKGKGITPPQVQPLPIELPQAKPEPENKPEKKPQEEEAEEEDEPDVKPEEEVTSEEGEESSSEKGPKGPETEDEKEEEEEAELNPDLFEGDLKLSKEEIAKLDENTISKKDAVAAAARKWTNARVPFSIDRRFSNDAQRMSVLRSAISEFNKKTCVRFVPRKRTDKNYIRFFVDKGCYSTNVGKKRTDGVQYISIGRGCNYLGTVIHEMMHAIGFFHEHTRLDRDQYVTINWANIEKDRESQFKKYGHGEGDYLNEPYDYGSVMHYPRTGFGVKVNGKPLATIVPKDKPWRKIGQRDGFSEIDLRQINKLYKCTKFTSKY